MSSKDAEVDELQHSLAEARDDLHCYSELFQELQHDAAHILQTQEERSSIFSLYEEARDRAAGSAFEHSPPSHQEIAILTQELDIARMEITDLKKSDANFLPKHCEVSEVNTFSLCTDGSNRKLNFAFVTVLNSLEPFLQNILDVLILAHSLRRSGSIHDLILLHDVDLPDSLLELFRQVGWVPRRVQAVRCHGNITRHNSNADRVIQGFVKLRAFELIQYAKVIILDPNMVIRHNIMIFFNYLHQLQCYVAIITMFNMVLL